MSLAYDNTTYLTSSRFVSGRIVEYDIKAANINCLIQAGKITNDQYDYLSKLPKQQREIEVGLMLKQDPKLYTYISKTIREAREYLVTANNIEEYNIVRIANDALYINTAVDLVNTKFGKYVEFIKKSTYNIFVRLSRDILFMINFLQDGNINVDIKGIGKSFIYHDQYLVSAIAYTLTIFERAGIDESLGYLSDIIEKYLHLELPVGYYREFTPESTYKSKIGATEYSLGYSMIDASENDKMYLDIGYNYTILRELWSIMIEVYSMSRR